MRIGQLLRVTLPKITLLVLFGLSIGGSSFTHPPHKKSSGIQLHIVWWFDELDTRLGRHIQDYDDSLLADTIPFRLTDSEIVLIYNKAKEDSIFSMPTSLVSKIVPYPPNQLIWIKSPKTGVTEIKWIGQIHNGNRYIGIRRFCEFVDTVVHRHPGFHHNRLSPGRPHGDD